MKTSTLFLYALNATLSKPVDARNAKPGDTVTATNDRDGEPPTARISNGARSSWAK
jgi:hypothetical protein